MKLDFNNSKILIVGDIMLDRYFFGGVSRISPEAPVPIVNVQKSKYLLGGAGNVAMNVAELEATATLVGFVGEDSTANLVKDLLKANNINDGTVVIYDRPTIEKTRIVGDHQQLLRLDFENTSKVEPKYEDAIISMVKSYIDKIDVVVLSDYAKGVCSERVCREVVLIANSHNKKVLVDPKGHKWDKYTGAYLITPNLKEAIEFNGGVSIPNIDEEVSAVGFDLRVRAKSDNLLITRSERGMSLFGSDGKATHIHTTAQEVFDVSGAGDTVVSTIAACLANGFELTLAVEIANRAAGIVVGKLGTVPITIRELRKSFVGRGDDVTVSKEDLVKIVEDVKARGGLVAFTNGVFDIIHKGHVTYLDKARSFGDILIVGLNSDASVKRLKGETRPINSELDRAAVLVGLRSVSYVCIFDEDTPYELIKAIKPDVLIKGGDYKIENVVGRDIAGRTVLIDFVNGYSTTSIIERSQLN